MKKSLIVLVVLLLLVIGGVGAVFYDGFNNASTRFYTRQELVSSTKIPSALDNLQILILSDIHYNQFMDAERFQTVVDKINKANPDVIIFLGDLFDNPQENYPSEEVIAAITAQLNSLDAPLGKFAVLGEQDAVTLEIKDLVKGILYNSNFEVLENSSVHLYNNSSSYIQLVGLENEINGIPNIEGAFQNVDNEHYTIVLCHTPDTANSIPTATADLILSGHSHGGQIYIPIIGPFETIPYAEIYNHGKYHLDQTILDVVGGLGTTKIDARVFAQAEIVVYTLKQIKPD